MARTRKQVDTDRLNTPGPRRRSPWMRMRMDSDAFGSFAETFARFMGTARFLMWMTVFILVWVGWNVFAPKNLVFDDYPFIFLTLILSLQASYAAPLILLAQNRQEARDRITSEADRKQSSQSKADMDFLAREIASLRMRVSDLATRDFIRGELRDFVSELDDRADEKARQAKEAKRRDKSSGATRDDTHPS